jgi:hypothetical protein
MLERLEVEIHVAKPCLSATSDVSTSRRRYCSQMDFTKGNVTESVLLESDAAARFIIGRCCEKNDGVYPQNSLSMYKFRDHRDQEPHLP